MRKNHPKHGKHTQQDLTAHFDVEYVFRPDCPNISRVIDHRRKLIMINMDAAPDADGIKHICYGGERITRM